MQRIKQAVFPLLLLLFSLAYLITARGLGASIVDGRLSPSFFPSILGTLAVLLSAVLLWRALSTTPDNEKAEPPSAVSRYRVLLISASTALFILAFQQIPYLFSATAYVLSIIVIFSDIDKLLTKFGIALLTALGAYLLFTQAFNVRLPALWG